MAFLAISQSAETRCVYALAESPSISVNQGKDTFSSVTSIGRLSVPIAFFMSAALESTILCRFSMAASERLSLGTATVSPSVAACGAFSSVSDTSSNSESSPSCGSQSNPAAAMASSTCSTSSLSALSSKMSIPSLVTVK